MDMKFVEIGKVFINICIFGIEMAVLKKGKQGLTSDYQYIDVLRDLVPFAQFKKREKHPWRSVTFNCTIFGLYK